MQGCQCQALAQPQPRSPSSPGHHSPGAALLLGLAGREMHWEVTFVGQGNSLNDISESWVSAEGCTRDQTMHRTRECHTNLNREFSVSCVRET